MKSNITRRVVLCLLPTLALLPSLRLHAQSTPSLTLTPTFNGVAAPAQITISQKAGPVAITAFIADSKGVGSAGIVSHAGVATGFGYGAKTLTVSSVFYGAYYRTGDYTVTMQASGGSGSKTWTGVIHLIP